jgi:hypothetical protein
MKAKYEATAEWLRRAAGSYHESERLYDAKLIHDMLVVHNYEKTHRGKISIEYLHELPEPELQPHVFENEFNLPIMPKKPLEKEQISEVLKIPVRYPGNPPPVTFEDQINRLLFPKWIRENKNWESNPEVLKEPDVKVINYSIRRIIIDRLFVGGFPANYKWLENPPGLDRLSAALITFHYITKLVSEDYKIPCEEFFKEEDYEDPITECDILNTCPNGSIAHKWQYELARLRRHINVLRNPIIGPLCLFLSKKNKPRRLVSKNIAKILKTSERKALVTKNYLELVIVERFLPIVSTLGLKYRYIVKYRKYRKGQGHVIPSHFRVDFDSPGLVTQMLGFELFRKDKDTVVRKPVEIQIHVEPINSESPKFEKNDRMINLVMDKESISLRLDLYNPDKKRPLDEPLWLKRDLPIAKSIALTPRQAQLLGVLWAHRGSSTSRQKLINLLGYPRRTAQYALEYLFNKKALSVMYYPAPELSGIHEMLMFIVQDAHCELIDEITRRFLEEETNRYVHLKKSRTGRDLIAYLRMPSGEFKMWDSANTFRDEYLDRADIRMIFIKKIRSYYITLPIRLFDTDNQIWIDPWRTE